MPTPQTIAIAASSLASLSHEALIELYNAESRRLSHGVGYIVRLFGSLARRAEQAAATRSNELAAMSPVSNEPTRQSKEDSLMSVPLNVAQEFRLMR